MELSGCGDGPECSGMTADAEADFNARSDGEITVGNSAPDGTYVPDTTVSPSCVIRNGLGTELRDELEVLEEERCGVAAVAGLISVRAVVCVLMASRCVSANCS